MATALNALLSLPGIRLAPFPTPVQELDRLRAALGAGCPRLLMKRDDLLAFGGGGNKVRKMQTVAAQALAGGFDALVTCGGVQSNHARVTAAAGAALGLRVVLVANGFRPATLTGNARLNALFGADVRYVASREERAPAMERVADELRAAGNRPLVVPLGASTPLGALGFARGVEELASSPYRPTRIVHSTSSGGTQAGLIIGSALFGLTHEIIGVSADDPAPALAETISALIAGAAERLAARPGSIGGDARPVVDDTFVGGGYGVPTPASTEAMEITARTEGIILDPVYTAKAMAGLIARVRAKVWRADETVLFWHTGGVPGFFA
ncbi:MAG: pyridoxal-phosphate dependent enzyme [Acidobacteria bacterium]|nr:MAG: pyridoxal-phosphate dependent enzyme [Acidobacteriota bacterium]